MTAEAEIAKKAAYKFEAKKDGLKQVQSGDVKLTLTIASGDMPSDLYSDQMGQRYVIAAAPINDDETPRHEPKKSFAGQAKMLAQDNAFERFVMQQKGQTSIYAPAECEQWIEYRCGVKSCAEIIEGTEAGKAFKRLQAQYLQWREN